MQGQTAWQDVNTRLGSLSFAAEESIPFVGSQRESRLLHCIFGVPLGDQDNPPESRDQI